MTIRSASAAEAVPNHDHLSITDTSTPLLTAMNGSGATKEPVTRGSPFFYRVLSALFYAAASFLIMVINKEVLTVYRFPSFQVLGLGQIAATLIVLQVGKWLRIITFPAISRDTFRKIWPMPLFYMSNMLFGLGGTQELSLPMLTVLRRFSILMTMIGEFYFLSVIPDMRTQMSVYMMIVGALIASVNDLAFSMKGYVFVLLNDFFTAANGIVTKKKLDAKDLGKYGIMYYNSLFVLLPTIAIAQLNGDFEASVQYSGWYWSEAHSPLPFIAFFILSCVFGFILTYATVLCTSYNSALTTTIIGCLKNISITYLGMVIGGDYVFSWPNFVGLNISILGSLIYTKVTFAPSAGVSSNRRTITVIPSKSSVT